MLSVKQDLLAALADVLERLLLEPGYAALRAADPGVDWFLGQVRAALPVG